MLAKLMAFFLLGLVRMLTGAQARWHGCPPKAEQRIYFANHQSHADLVMIWAALPEVLRSITRPIAAKDYWTKTPFKKWITTEVFNAVYVDRERVEGVDPMAPLFEALEQGDSIILFPEGTRGNAEQPQAFKAGLYNLAMKFPHVGLVPAWINNIQRVMPKGEVVPVLCSVTFGVPMRLEEGEDRSVFLNRARATVIAFTLREFITLSPTRGGDHRSLILAFFVVLSVQFYLVSARWFDLFTVFIPVYVFLAIPVISALANDPERFLERNAKLQWGIMVCVCTV